MNPRGTSVRPMPMPTYRREVRRFLTLVMALAIALGIAAPAGAVVNGSSSTPGTFGFLVALLDTQRLSTMSVFQSQFCGGSLTTPTTVVTAAHCVVNQKDGTRDLPTSLVVALGRSLKDPAIRTVAVTAITVHPSYSTSTGENDVAVLTLAAPQTDIQTITPLKNSDTSGLDASGTKVMVAGWGSINAFGNTFPDTFRTGELILLPVGTCGQGQNYSLNGVTFLAYQPGEANSASMLCAIGINANGQIVDSCKGDSGGPLVAGEGLDTRLVGLVSWGLNCATRHPGVYTKLSAMTDFLNSSGALGAPAPPTISVTALNQRVRVTFTSSTQGASFTTFTAAVTATPTQQCVAAPIAASASASCDITGLVNGQQYAISATGTSGAGPSATSTALNVTPIAVPDAGRIKTAVVDGRKLQVRVTNSVSETPLLATRIACLPTTGGPGRSAKIVQGAATIKRLAPGDYSCSVTARNEFGTSSGPQQIIRITA